MLYKIYYELINLLFVNILVDNVWTLWQAVQVISLNKLIAYKLNIKIIK